MCLKCGLIYTLKTFKLSILNIVIFGKGISHNANVEVFVSQSGIPRYVLGTVMFFGKRGIVN